MKHQDALDQLARETKLARKRLGFERTMRAGLWLALAIGFWALIALSGFYDFLPLLAQSLGALAALCVFAWIARRAIKAWRPPSEAEARARLAADSRLELGAFESLNDRPSRLDASALALWKREQEQAIARAERARAGPSQIRFDDLDRFKLRYIIPCALVLGLLVAGGDAGDRLSRAFLPDPGPLLGDGPLQVEAWATPADYTHAPPVSLSDRLGQRIETPPSVEATVRVTGPAGAPRLVFDGAGGRRDARFVRAADGAWEAHLALPGPGRLKIVRFHALASWQMAPAPDLAPQAAFTAPLSTLTEERVTVAWRAGDDYGLSRLALRVRPVNPPPGLIGAAPVDTPLEAPAGDLRTAQGEQTLELADHPYAGMEVQASIVAFDALGQAGESVPMRFTMPEHVFLQPLARAAIELRRDILYERRPYRGAPDVSRHTIPAGDVLFGNQRIELRDYASRNDLARAPEGIQRAVHWIDALTMAPRDGYFRDLAVYLGLRQARADLTTARTIDDTNAAADQLWQTALRAEYGGAADARHALEQAQQALADALANGASQQQIQQLMAALRDATARYLQSLVQDALQNHGRQSQQSTQNQTQVSQQDIEDLLQQVQRLSQQGRTQEAQQMLQMLNNILQHLDARLNNSNDQDNQGQSGGRSDQRMQQSMDNLADTIGRQRALRDDTEQQQDNPQSAQQQQQSQNGQQQQSQQQNTQQQQQQNAQQQRQSSMGGSGGQQQGGEGGSDLAQRQADIHQALSDAQRMAGAAGARPSPALDAAGQAMRQAENALRRDDLSSAASQQNSALEHLREGADQLAAQMAAQGGAQGNQGASGPRDPLGRLSNGTGIGDGDTRVPTNIDPARARQIFDEIRRRAQDPNRPEAEREYLRRLMERFGQP